MAWIDVDGVTFKDLFMLEPLVKGGPVVPADEQRERYVGVVVAQMRQRVVGIGRLRKGKLIVARLEPRCVGGGSLEHFQPDGVIKEVVVDLERILRRHHEPHLVKPCLLVKGLRKGYMGNVGWVECATEDAYLFDVGGWCVGTHVRYWMRTYRLRNSSMIANVCACAVCRSSLMTIWSNFGAKVSS